MKTAVLIPCYNEAKTIGRVVADFKEKMPHADIYVYDNNKQQKKGKISFPNKDAFLAVHNNYTDDQR
jgi:cellulose synthase/poly-beta-1,6-N-acetylglucosamine synthase-like glycosyltransferase